MKIPSFSALRRSRPLKVVGAGVIVFLWVVMAATLLQDKDAKDSSGSERAALNTKSEPADDGRPRELSIVKREADDPYALGDPKAPLVVIMWTDMRCPYCAVFMREVLPAIETDYIDTGKVRLEIRDVAMFGAQSQAASVAAHAAGEQDKFIDFINTVYEAAPEGKKANLPRTKLIDFAQNSGVPDMDRFKRGLDSAAFRQEIDHNGAMAQNLGISTVPFFIAGTSALQGAQPVNVFRSFLEAELKKFETSAG